MRKKPNEILFFKNFVIWSHAAETLSLNVAKKNEKTSGLVHFSKFTLFANWIGFHWLSLSACKMRWYMNISLHYSAPHRLLFLLGYLTNVQKKPFSSLIASRLGNTQWTLVSIRTSFSASSQETYFVNRSAEKRWYCAAIHVHNKSLRGPVVKFIFLVHIIFY